MKGRTPMMINCPKCGFSQPEDQYCAKCGVDMLSYRPREKSISEKFLHNTSMQLIALGLVIVVCFMGYQVTRTARHFSRTNAAGQELDRIMASNESSEGAADMSQREDMPAPNMPKAASVDRGTSNTHAAQTNAEADANNPEAGGAAKTVAAAGAGATAAPASAVASSAKIPDATQMRVSFTEVPKSVLADWFVDSKTPLTQSGGGVATGVIGDFRKKIKAATNGWRLLEAPIDQAIQPKQIVIVYKGAPDSFGQNIGLSLQLTTTSLEAGGATVSVVSSRNLRESTPQGPTVTEVDFPDQQFTIPQGAAAMISGTLLHRTLLDEEIRFYSTISVLRVMTSEGYRTGSTEFAIFIEPH